VIGPFGFAKPFQGFFISLRLPKVETCRFQLGLSRFGGHCWVCWRGVNIMNKTISSTKEGEAHTKSSNKAPRRRYEADFKKSAVELCLRNGGSIAQTALELGINHWTLIDWVNAHRRKQSPPPQECSEADLRSQIARLKAELSRVSEQRDILKKTLGILSLP